jgi:hypothetical protein
VDRHRRGGRDPRGDGPRARGRRAQPRRVNAAGDALLLTLQTPSPDAAEIANSLWARQDIAFKQTLERVRTYYAAG